MGRPTSYPVPWAAGARLIPIAIFYGSTVPELQEPAFDWFCGRSISEENRKRLGVEGPLESDDDGMSALGLLARLLAA